MRSVLTNQIFKRPGLLAASEYERLKGPVGRRRYDLIGDDRSVWCKREPNATKWLTLEPAEWDILEGYARAPNIPLTPRKAHGGAGKYSSALTNFKRLRKKIDVQVGRRRWELFQPGGTDASGNLRFIFAPGSGFRYVIVPRRDVPPLIITVRSAVYALSPATGVFVDVVLEKTIGLGLIVRQAHVEIPPLNGRGDAPRILRICEVVAGAIPDPRLDIPPFALEPEDRLVRGRWPFALIDDEYRVVAADGETKAILSVVVGDGEEIRVPIRIHRDHRPYRRVIEGSLP